MLKNHSFEWIIQRLTAIWSIFSLFFILYLFVINFRTTLLDFPSASNFVLIFWDTWASPDLNSFFKIFIFFSLIILFFHLFLGVHNIIQDYVHNEKTKYFIEILIKLIQIESLKYIYIFLFL